MHPWEWGSPGFGVLQHYFRNNESFGTRCICICFLCTLLHFHFQGDIRKVQTIIDSRKKMFTSDISVLSYLLHPRHKGVLLDQKQRRVAMQYIGAAVDALGLQVCEPHEARINASSPQAPSLDDVLNFIEGNEPYDMEATCSAYHSRPPF